MKKLIVEYHVLINSYLKYLHLEDIHQICMILIPLYLIILDEFIFF